MQSERRGSVPLEGGPHTGTHFTDMRQACFVSGVLWGGGGDHFGYVPPGVWATRGEGGYTKGYLDPFAEYFDRNR